MLLYVEKIIVFGICINIVFRGCILDFMCLFFGDRKLIEVVELNVVIYLLL